jgi:hypothetical protein
MVNRRAFLTILGGAAVAGLSRGALAGDLTSLPIGSRMRGGFPHPEPRPGITGEHVLPEDEIGSRKRVREAYAAARTHPEIFDGVFCACECHESMNHRSLLSCFESRQAIGCAACREESEFVGRLARDGKTLDEIRRAVDKEFSY